MINLIREYNYHLMFPCLQKKKKKKAVSRPEKGHSDPYPKDFFFFLNHNWANILWHPYYQYLMIHIKDIVGIRR